MGRRRQELPDPELCLASCGWTKAALVAGPTLLSSLLHQTHHHYSNSCLSLP